MKSKAYYRILLLQAYTQPRNKTQAQKAIEYEMGIRLKMGRLILPLTQELIDQKLLEKVVPPNPGDRGHFCLITPKGRTAIEDYQKRFSSIGNPNPKFGY